MSFSGFGEGAIRWFEGLERENSKRYFEATRSTFVEQVHEPFELLLEELCDRLGGQVRVFRQNRDVRFSPDKSPYKTGTYGVIHSRPNSSAALYARISAQGLYAGTGYWQMAADQLERYGNAVLDDTSGPALEAAVHTVRAAGLELGEPALKTAPRGLPRDHARSPLLRYKSLIAGRRLHPDAVLAGRRPLDFVSQTWDDAQPLTAWLDLHVGASSDQS